MEASPTVTAHHDEHALPGTVIWPLQSLISLQSKTLDALLRVVSGRELDWCALEDQERSVRRAAEAHGFTIGKVSREAGVSGCGRRPRPLLAQALHRVSTGASDGIVVSRLDRVGRDVHLVSRTLDELADLGGLLVSAER